MKFNYFKRPAHTRQCSTASRMVTTHFHSVCATPIFYAKTLEKN